MKRKPTRLLLSDVVFRPGLIVSWEETPNRRAVAILVTRDFYILAVNHEGDGSMDEDTEGDFHRVWYADELPQNTPIYTANQEDVNKLLDIVPELRGTVPDEIPGPIPCIFYEPKRRIFFYPDLQ